MASIAELISDQSYKNMLTALNVNVRNTVNVFLTERNNKLKARQELQKELQLARQERQTVLITAKNHRNEFKQSGKNTVKKFYTEGEYKDDYALLKDTKQLDNFIKQELIQVDIEIQLINEDIQLLEKALGEIQELETKAAVTDDRGKLIRIFKDIRTKHERVFENITKDRKMLVQEESARKKAQELIQQMKKVTQQETQLENKELILVGSGK